MKPFNKEQNYGWVEPKVDKEDYLFGSGKVDLSKPIRPDGQWPLVKEEVQNKPFETSNCTGFATTTQIEILLKHMEGIEYNFSERGLGIRSGTYPPGNDPQRVFQQVRKRGIAKDSLLPFGGKNVDEYYDKSNITPEVEQSEKEFLSKYDFKHDWVSSGKLTSPRTIKFALKYSPLAVAIYAFAFDGEYYIRAGKDGDFIVITGYEDGKYWKGFTSYDPVIKKFAWDFGFYWVKRVHLSKAVKKQSFWTWLLDYLKEIWR